MVGIESGQKEKRWEDMGIGRRQDEKVTGEKKEKDWMEEDKWGQIQGARGGERRGRKKRRNSGKKERGKERGRKVIINYLSGR